MNAILLFVKYPEPGRVKTRIAVETGPERAAEIYRELVARVLEQLPRGVPVLVQFDPPEKADAVRAWLPGAAGYTAQASGDLGARLESAFAQAFRAGWQRLAVIGSDCVELTPELFHEAFAALDSHDAAIGPVEDGGYYLLALRAPQPRLFENIRWSTEHTLADTLAQAAALRVALLPKLRDVDTLGDFERWKRAFARASAPVSEVA